MKMLLIKSVELFSIHKEKENKAEHYNLVQKLQAATGGQRRSKSLSFQTYLAIGCWRRKWQPTPVFLPGESQGQRSPVGCRLQGCTESDTTEVTQQQQQQQQCYYEATNCLSFSMPISLIYKMDRHFPSLHCTNPHILHFVNRILDLFTPS